MRKPVIAGNWKLFKTKNEALALIEELAPQVKDVDNVEIIVAPVFTVLPSLVPATAGTNISLAAQDVFWEEEGAFTGEVSSRMLLDAGASHVIIGHSERRQYFGETEATVNKKTKAALAGALVPIMCIGETLDAREAGDTFKVLETQLKGGLEGLTASQFAPVIVAYEPVWAIGTGKTATDDQAQEAHAFIRGVLASLYGQETAGKTRILYGGSVKAENVKGLMSCADIDGALVGGASLKAATFAPIVRFRD
ncbi:triose-phosphate isomerase [Geomonas sp. Red32]|uniref:triose-phosphate isomerase n=1 Tax=Geomonas sp. Red32 TaxID=2912856 RepID=UPI00202CCB05|nr:triose-phosphate isomerase [Geomonas sp. Red32]MCM0083055.1 triose-phosphate isomerase [Geomonas sp. Red32]